MSGSSLAAALLAVVSVLPAPAAQKKSKKAPAAYGIVSGTVFRDPGFALPDAKVILFSPGDPKPKKLQESVTNYRGEFEFRVPPNQATYLVRASSKGYRPEEKQTSISGEEQVEVNLVLSPENK
jgi:hypothetical protein